MTVRTRYEAGRVIWFAVALLAFGCQRKSIPVVEPLPPSPVVMRLPDLPDDSLYAGLISSEQVFAFYHGVSFALQWSGDHGLQDSLLKMLHDARAYGLEPQHYHVDTLRDSALAPFRREVLLTDAFLAFGHDLRYGHQDKLVYPEADSVRREVLRRALTEGRLRVHLESLEPPFEGYRQLRRAWGQLVDTEAESPEQWRAVQINLDRWRMERKPWGMRYLLVQVPSFMLYLVDGDSVILSSRVVVGEPETPTPELTSTVTRVVTYPYWHVPRKIAIKEYLPAIQQDVSVVEQNNFEVLNRDGKVLHPDSVDWASFNSNYFPVSLRQKEGHENALGIIKFEFRNPYGVFLHDTNARRLFRESVRAFSHGCIRMEKAEALAHYLVTGSLDKKSSQLTKYLAQKEKHVISVSAPIPVYVRYFTAEARDGELRFYADLYSKDGPR
ncbi:MAG: L,D-transpeptidase family protein [Cyclobacteriaceae bacterium]|nr:L,D-transpeptidase family protein [Cyclobacteriaceae bacterium]